MSEPAAELPYEIPEVITWSYSAYKDFANCPKKYFHTRVLKDYTSAQTNALTYGKTVHAHLEAAVRDGTPVPGAVGPVVTSNGAVHQSIANRVRAMKGFKLVEFEMGVTPDLQPCDFSDPGRWWRGIADVVILDGEKAYIIDYKTGASSRFADLDQLRILAAALCLHWPEIQTIRGALLFTELDTTVVMETLGREQALALWDVWKRNLHPLRVAYEKNVWNTRKSGLCRFCPVTSCLHHPEY